MAAGAGGGPSLEETPTWAVALVCFCLVSISIVIEYMFHIIGKWLTKRHKTALYEALEKIKSELMLLGFISLLLTVGQGFISEICIPESIGDTWHPCSHSNHKIKPSYKKGSINIDRRLLRSIPSSSSGGSSNIINNRRVLAGGGYDDKCAAKGKVPFVSADGIHQLHIFIFALAVFHVIYCITMLALGRAKMKKWKKWEMETKTGDYQFSHDPERFRLARDTSFGRRHMSFWSHSSILLWTVCFSRQFIRSIHKVDYLTLRHGFIIAHLAPHSQIQFNFQNYIKRSLEDDFKVVVGISPTIWFFAVIFLLFNTHGWYAYLWLPFIPLIVILLVGTKLQVIITRMGLRIQERGDVVKGVPVVEPCDDLFWFNKPRLLLYLIHFVLFQNAFQLAFFAWSWFEFGLKSCFHEHFEDLAVRITMGIVIHILCSYVTLPLYALVSQMGSTMKPTIFSERIAKALRGWHHTARKHARQARRSGSITSTATETASPSPSHGMSPVHLLQSYYRSEPESAQISPRTFDNESRETDSSLSRSQNQSDASLSQHRRKNGQQEHVIPRDVPELNSNYPRPQLEIEINTRDFSFDKR